MRKLIGAGVAVILAATLAGCAPAVDSRPGEVPDYDDPKSLTIVTKTLSDGVILECAYITDTTGRSGFQCNWEGVNAERERNR